MKIYIDNKNYYFIVGKDSTNWLTLQQKYENEDTIYFINRFKSIEDVFEYIKLYLDKSLLTEVENEK